ncbi:MAG: hypothetical protein M3337_03190 [Actinomycetota bacterium]|nr:hypothetical protein [Actinomycetota bacterium]
MRRRRAKFTGWALLGAAMMSCTGRESEDPDPVPSPTLQASTRQESTAPDSAPAGSTGPRSPAPGATAARGNDLEYDWKPAPIGAGGYVTGIISARRADGDAVIYARTDVGGAFRWDDGSETWQQMLGASALQSVGPQPQDSTVASITAAPDDGDILYVAVGDDFDPSEPGDELEREGRVLRSHDGGATWSTSQQRWFVSGNQQFRVGTERLAVDPDDPRHVVFATQREGLWRSSDAGESWEQVPLDRVPDGVGEGGAGDQAGVNFAMFATTGGSARLFVGVSNQGVYASDDGGDTWDVVFELNEDDVPAGPAIAGDALLFAVNTPSASAARLVRVDVETTTVGELGVPIASQAWHVAVDPTDEQRLVLADEAVRDGHLWTSDDGGESWTLHDIEIESPEIPWLERTDLDEYMSTGRLMFDPDVPGRVWFAEGMGVWRTDDIEAPTVTWTSASVGIEETVVSGVTVLPDGTAIATVADRQGFRLAVDGTYPASTLIDGRFASGSSVDYSGGHPDAVAWVGAESQIGTSPDRTARGAVSSDGAEAWQEMQGLNSEMFGGEVAVSATDPSVMVWLPAHFENPAAFSTDPVGVYVSDDRGRSWTNRSIDGEDDSFHRLFWWFTRRALAADRVNGNFYLLSDEERLLVSDDGAKTWSAAPHAPPCSLDDECHVVGQVQAMPGAAGHLWASVGSAGLYQSADAGQSPWSRIEGIDVALAFAFGAPMTPDEESALFVYGRLAGDPELGLWRSDDLGGEWSLVSRYPLDLANRVNAIAGDPTTPGRIYVGFAGNGVAVGDTRTR